MASKYPLDQFEEAWNDTGPPDILAFAKLLIASGEEVQISELCQIDLERRWRGPQTLSRRTSQDYLDLLDCHWSREQLIELICWEFHVRNRWGDFPPLLTMLAGRQELRPELEFALQEIASRLVQPLVSLTGVSDGPQPFSLDGPLEIGRQLPGEPEPYTTLKTVDGLRLIVASHSNAAISRHQLSIRRSSETGLTIHNLSQNRAVSLFEHGALGAGETRDCSLPIKIHLQSTVVLHIELPSPSA